ncbi:murein biosynthesis integral membrane protein MurJ, partial [Bacillus sp. MM2020_4]
IISIVFSLVFIFTSKWIVTIIAPGIQGTAYFRVAVLMSQIMIPSIIFLTTSSIITSVLQINNKFYISSSINISNNIITIIFAFVGGLFGNIYWLAIGTLFGAVSQLIIQLPSYRRLGLSFKVSLDINVKPIRETLKLVGPAFIGIAAFQINTLVDRYIASGLGEGSIAALTLANRLLIIPQGLFVVAIYTVNFPILTKMFNKGDIESFRRVYSEGISLITLLTIPLSFYLYFFSEPLIQIFFEYNSFDSQATTYTANALKMFSVGMLGLCLREYLVKVYYSMKMTMVPMYTSIFAIILNIILSLFLSSRMGYEGIALATSIAMTVATILLLIIFIMRQGDFGVYTWLYKVFIITICSTISITSMTYIYKYFDGKINIFANQILILLVGCVVYILFLLLLRNSDMISILNLLRSKVNMKNGSLVKRS